MRRRSYCTLAPPSGPGVQENIAAGLSWNAWLGGRDAQSIAFLSAAVREKLLGAREEQAVSRRDLAAQPLHRLGHAGVEHVPVVHRNVDEAGGVERHAGRHQLRA